jgi:FAD:protein FMN transferase
VKMSYLKISLFSLVVLLFSCADNQTKEIDVAWQVFQGEAQGTTYTIQTVGEGRKVSKKEVDDLLKTFDASLSTYLSISDINQFNNSVEGIEIADKNGFFQKCLVESYKVFNYSRGAFDPTVFPLVEGWGFFKDLKTPLSKEKADSILEFVDFSKGNIFDYQLIDGKLKLSKKDPRLKLDFNAIAQGFSVDVVFDFLKSKGYKNIFVEIGGEIRVSGVNKEGNKWRIGIDKPIDNGEREIQEIIELNNRAVATSGNYRKFYELDGKKYAHTINPKTGMQVKHQLLSASVLAPTAALADGFATAFMVLGKDKALEIMRQHPEMKLDLILISDVKGKLEVYSTLKK